MQRAVFIFLFGFAVANASGQTVSRSGQFVVTRADGAAGRPYVAELSTNRALVKLEPGLVAVSCERIKQTLLAALGVGDQWRGRIQVRIHPARAANEDIQVGVSRYTDAWNYDVSVPERVEASRLVRAITQVLLLEMANRALPPQSANLPAWLAEGMPQYLMAVSDVDLVLKPAGTTRDGDLPQRLDQHEGRLLSPFSKARERLAKQSPLTLQQLGEPDMNGGADSPLYRDTALLLVNELLQLKNGGQCLFAMLPELAWDPDWRVGFLKAFRQHFARERDFERWWALQSAYFVARDSNQVWSRADSLAKLEAVLRTPFAVRLGSNEPALYTDVPVQAIITGWKLEEQMPALKEKISLLDQLDLRMAPDVRPLLRQYRDVLQKYVTRQDVNAGKPADVAFGRHPALMPRKLQARSPGANDAIVRETLQQLATLDAHTEGLKRARENAPETREIRTF